jgi:hypothetical protein
MGVPAYITRGDCSSGKTVHISRHDGEHYNSVVAVDGAAAAKLQQSWPRSKAKRGHDQGSTLLLLLVLNGCMTRLPLLTDCKTYIFIYIAI